MSDPSGTDAHEVMRRRNVQATTEVYIQGKPKRVNAKVQVSRSYSSNRKAHTMAALTLMGEKETRMGSHSQQGLVVIKGRVTRHGRG